MRAVLGREQWFSDGDKATCIAKRTNATILALEVAKVDFIIKKNRIK